MIRHLVGIFFIVCLIGGLLFIDRSTNLDNIVDNNLKSTVAIKQGEAIAATGVFVAPDLMITAKHNPIEDQKLSLMTNHGKMYNFGDYEVVYKSDKYDYQFVRVPDKQQNYVTINCNFTPSYNSRYFSIGYPRESTEPIIHFGYFAGTNKYKREQYDIEMYSIAGLPGISGSGVFSAISGDFVGLSIVVTVKPEPAISMIPVFVSQYLGTRGAVRTQDICNDMPQELFEQINVDWLTRLF